MLVFDETTGEFIEDGKPAGPLPAAQTNAMVANMRAGRGVVDPRSGLALDDSGQPMVTGLPAHVQPAQARAMGLAPPQQPAIPSTAPAGPVAPEAPKTRVDTDRTTTTTKEKVTEGERKAEADVQASMGRQADLAQQQGEIDKARAKAAGEAEAAKGAAAGEYQTRVNQVLQAADVEYRRRIGAYDAEVQRLKGMEPTDFWKSKGTASKIAGAFAVAMGAYASALTRGPNTALQIIDTAIDNHAKTEARRYSQQRDIVTEAKGRAQDVTRERDAQIQGLSIVKAAAYEKLEAEARAKAAQFEGTQAGLRAQQLAEELRTKAAQERARFEASQREKVTDAVRRSVTTISGGPGSGAAGGQKEFQAKYGVLAQQMAGELQTIRNNPALSADVLNKLQRNQLATESADKSAGGGLFSAAGVALGRGVGLIPRSRYDGMTPQEQKVANAWDNLIEKYSRVLTGAGMPADEARRMAVQDAPHAGDSAEVVNQKLQRMEAATAQFMGAAGMAPGPTAAAPAASGGPDWSAAVAWARANPRDPRSAEIMRRFARGR